MGMLLSQPIQWNRLPPPKKLTNVGPEKGPCLKKEMNHLNPPPSFKGYWVVFRVYFFVLVAHFVSFFAALFQGHYSLGLQQLLQAEEAETGQFVA